MMWISKLFELRGLRARHSALIAKCTGMLKEKTELQDQLAKYKEWENNPFLMLKSRLPELNYSELLLEWDKNGDIVPLRFNFNALPKSDRQSHLSESNIIHRSKAFHNETNLFIKDIQRQIVLISDSGETNKMLRQLLIFVLAIKQRFEMLSNIYENEQKPKKPIDEHHPIGQ